MAKRKIRKPARAPEPEAPTVVSGVPSSALKASRPFGKRAPISAMHGLRRRSELAFIQDPEGRSVLWHHAHGPTEAHLYVSPQTYQNWSASDDWVPRRIKHWQAIEDRVLAHVSDQQLKQRLKEIEDLALVRKSVLEMLMPQRNPKTGEVLRDEETKLPLFSVALPPFDRLVRAFLELDDRLRATTGAAQVTVVGRTSVPEAGGAPRLGTGSSDEAERAAPRLTLDEARALARALVVKRHADSLGTKGKEDERKKD